MTRGRGNGDLHYAHEKIGLAVNTLATTHGTLSERLLEAWMGEGHHALPMGPGQAGPPMSDDLVDKLEAFDERMSCEPAKAKAGEGRYAATILSHTDDEASEAARDLVEIDLQIEGELQDV